MTVNGIRLKVPKLKIFVTELFFTLSDPTVFG
jgi:hypothetical protein